MGVSAKMMRQDDRKASGSLGTDLKDAVADAPAGLIDGRRNEALDLACDRTDGRPVLAASIAVIWQRGVNEKVVRGCGRRGCGCSAWCSRRGRARAGLSRGGARGRCCPVDERLGGGRVREELVGAYADDLDQAMERARSMRRR
jgi:hypothetical protein